MESVHVNNYFIVQEILGGDLKYSYAQICFSAFLNIQNVKYLDIFKLLALQNILQYDS